MNRADKLRVADAIYQKQPNLLASVLVQRNFGASDQRLELLTDLLLVCWEAVRESGETWPVITEEFQGKMLARLVEHIRFREGLPPTYGDIAITQ